MRKWGKKFVGLVFLIRKLEAADSLWSSMELAAAL